MTDTKEIMRQAGKKRLTAEPMDPGVTRPSTDEANPEDEVRGRGKDGKARALWTRINKYLPMESMDDPLKRTIWRMPKKWQRRIRKAREITKTIWRKLSDLVEWVWYQRPWRELTDEEKRIREENRHRKLMSKLLKDEAKLYRQRIINRCTARGLCYRKKQYEVDGMDLVLGLFGMADAQVSRVSFDHVVMQPDAIYFRVNTMTLPRGVGITDLNDDELVTDLSVACGRAVRADFTFKTGLWFTVERASGTRGIPNHVRFGEMLERYPKTAGRFTIPMGMTENKKAIYRDITAQPHLLIAGETGGGKSNMIHVIIASLLMRTDPDNLKMIMVDLKGGLELGHYEGIPHLLDVEGSDGGIIYDRENVPAALDYLIEIGEVRAAKLKAAGSRNLSSYNKHKKANRLPRILLIIDEWADIRLVRGLGTKCERRLSNLAQKMRAVGIHIILATQSPKREVISTLIKTNLPGKMAFSCPTNTASILIIDSALARGLQPNGRYIYQKGSESLEIQAPYVSDKQLRKIAAGAIDGHQEVQTRGHDVTEREIITYSVDQLEGGLGVRDIYNHFRGRMTQKAVIDMLGQMDEKKYTLRGNTYQVEPAAGPVARHLELMEED
jgi:hypothetical protein